MIGLKIGLIINIMICLYGFYVVCSNQIVLQKEINRRNDENE